MISLNFLFTYIALMVALFAALLITSAVLTTQAKKYFKQTYPQIYGEHLGIARTTIKVGDQIYFKYLVVSDPTLSQDALLVRKVTSALNYQYLSWGAVVIIVLGIVLYMKIFNH